MMTNNKNTIIDETRDLCTMKQLPFIILALVGLLLPTACHTPEGTESDENALKIGFVPSADALPYMVAEQIGVFDSLELDVRFVPMSNVEERDTSFLRHHTDGLLLSFAESCRLQHDSVDLVPTIATGTTYYMMVPYDSLLVTSSCLNGKTLGLQLYSGEHHFTDEALRRFQLTYEDVNLINISDERTRLQMLLNGQLDAAVLTDPQVSFAKADSCILLAVSTPNRREYEVLAFSDSILEHKGEEIRRLIIGYNRGVDYINQHPTSAWLPTASARMGLPFDTLCIKHEPFEHAISITPKMKSEIQQWLSDKELLPQKKWNFRTANINLEN